MKRTDPSRRTRAPRGRAARAGNTRSRSSALRSPAAFARAFARRDLKPAPKKVLLSLRIDGDVIEWFRRQGPGYQSRMNALLRAYMEAHL
jgi:uncharacterized protein (DUF4415 family)